MEIARKGVYHGLNRYTQPKSHHVSQPTRPNPKHWSLDAAYQSQADALDIELIDDKDDGHHEAREAALKHFTGESRLCCAYELGEQTETLACSKHGGRPLFPVELLGQWPICEYCGEEMHLKFQLRQIDIPALMCPVGKDMLQIFWCPHECGEEDVSQALLWHKEAEITQPAETTYGDPMPGRKLVCRELVDRPSRDEISIRSDFDYVGDVDVYMNGEIVNLGTIWDHYEVNENKIGGYPSWIQSAWRCCDAPMQVIVQTAWAEGYSYILGCLECGTIDTDYQGT